ncbi:RDD family protein [Chryseobacterium suipulveris]|uniref:RDD family protein n=1 Tax=Chryseobacterium suipulveris TaxID=2929800 RepID=A0ABY4BSS6_9FLAO|nr:MULTISPECIES: RDD family protein [Chryseobacterium]UOE42194.1 RDD family protein [Chryseobacterium suipulveris]UOE42238.1 RDD family protein [Chryseobacterium suipulveris]UOE42247.1 RDD family protein [Chryseobacterium suipulveris]
MKKEKYLISRIIAGVIDYSIVLTLTCIYIFTFGEKNELGEYSVNGLKAIPIFIFWFFYFCVIESTLNSTLGNYLMKLKPVDLNTEKNIDFKQSFLRHLLDPIDMSLFGLVGIIIIKNSPESQRLGDLLAKTKVIKLTE